MIYIIFIHLVGLINFYLGLIWKNNTVLNIGIKIYLYLTGVIGIGLMIQYYGLIQLK